MKYEEIEKKAEALETEYGIDLSVSALKSFGVELVLQAYDLSARMVCGQCLNELRLEQRGECWYHPAQSYWPESQCKAEGIHALKGLLARKVPA